MFVWSYLIKYAHNDLISDFSLWAFAVSFFKLELSNFAQFEILSGCITSVPCFLFTVFQYGCFYDYFNDSLINFIRDFASTWKHGRNRLIFFFFKSGMQVQLCGPLINLFLVVLSRHVCRHWAKHYGNLCWAAAGKMSTCTAFWL